jgi:hypothetical protein
MRTVLIAVAVIGALGLGTAGTRIRAAEEVKISFDKSLSVTRLTTAELGLARDWSQMNFLVLEMRASSSERFELALESADGVVSKRIHPMPNVWVRASIPLSFYRQGLGDGIDLAATVNKPHNSYWINVEAGGHGPVHTVDAITFTMRYPVVKSMLEIRSVKLAKEDPGDAVLDDQPVVDKFGQYARLQWAGKAASEDGLKKEWSAESTALAGAEIPAGRTKFGGFAALKRKATGYFRVEKVDGRWWFVDPEGALFWSSGVNGVGPGPATPTQGRERDFEEIPQPGAARNAGRGPVGSVSFHAANLSRRYGADWQHSWADDTARRMRAWGLNTTYGTTIADQKDLPVRIPYVITLRGWQTQGSIMGMPDVYSPEFAKRVEQFVAEQLDPRKDDSWLLGYFVGNEPPWPGRESQLVDLVLAGPQSELQRRFKETLAAGDTPERRQAIVLDAFRRYLEVINTTVKRHDPHHLNLGIRFGGRPPECVMKMAKGFDVYSMNKYRWEPPVDELNLVAKDLDLPILIGEFHFGVPEHGMAPGLIQTMNQQERGLAYRHYVESAAAHPSVVGAHWFEWIDEPVTGRNDGENYNIGWVDVTDRPYRDFIREAMATNEHLDQVHAGKIPPMKRVAKASQVGTPVDGADFGLHAIQ